jgi:U3 small nucleolar RNA-associated protein 22
LAVPSLKKVVGFVKSALDVHPTMPAPALKRRKTDHVSSSDEADDASFASFGEDGTDDGHGMVNRSSEEFQDAAEELNDEMDEDEDDADEEMEDANITSNKVQHTASAHSTPAKPAEDNRKRPDNKAQSGANAYASGTFKSNVFKLQVDELLGQIRPRHGQRETSAESALHQIKQSIEHIPSRGPFLINEAERDLLKEKVAIPFPDPPPPKDAKYKFAFAKPANINVTGSYALKTTSRSRERVELDMVVAMPGSLFEEKDYINYRYFYKRAYYLACIGAGLQKAHKGQFKLQFKLSHDDALSPILAVTRAAESPEQTPASRWVIYIIPSVAQTQFPAQKLQPTKNCVRNTGADNENEEALPTPFYNSSLRSDMLTTAYLKLLHGTAKSCDAFRDACLLGSTWLKQRGFTSSIAAGGFGNFEWATLIALCLQGGGPNGKPMLSEGYSSYQLFKATLQLFAVKDLVKQPLQVGSGSDIPRIDGKPMVWDAERSHDLLYKLGEWSYRLLRHEAKTTLATLGDSLHDGFDATFILRVHEPSYRFDFIAQVPERLLLTPKDKADHVGPVHVQRLYTVLKQGLGDRCNQVSISTAPSSAWGLGSSRPQVTSKRQVMVGLIVNPDTVKRTVDHGPSAEQKVEASAFRKFWGEKAELRRFKDGSIHESLIWASPQESGQSVLEQIMRYLLARHFGAVTTDDLKLSHDNVSKLLKTGADITPFNQIMSRYKQFETDLRSLSELPLSIRQIMPTSAQLCYSSRRTPANGQGRPVPADVVIQFEGSGRWPDDLVAIQRTKIAFLLKIDELLKENVENISTRIGLENEDQDILNQAFLDVTYDLDATFRLRIYHDREQTLLERQLKSKTTDPKSREVAAVGLAKYKRDYTKAPAQTQAITRLCTRFPVLSGSIRLTKKWFASHLLDNHISEALVELLVIRTFTQPWPWQNPSSVQTGFLRTLAWISKWDWRADPLVVDLSASGELKQPDMQAIRTNFEAWRKLDPAMNRVALFAASNLDHDGTTWTDGRPAKVVAGRMTALAKAACAEIAEKRLELEPINLFSSPLSDFDFVLHLNSAVAAGRSRKPASSKGFKNLELDSLDDDSLIGYDPVHDYLQDLESIYGSAVLFFSGGSERNVITGLWSPLTERRSWKVNLAYSTIPVKGTGEDDDVQAVMNKEAILAEIARLGGDLVEKVEVC